jgi:hypothetical protein
MKMKTISTIAGFIIALFCINNSSFCQNTFKFTIKDPLTDEFVNDAIELADGSFILACNQSHPLPSRVHLLRLSQSGNQLGSTEFYYQGQSSGFINILQINPNQFLFAGYTLNDNKNKIWIYEADSLFNEINSKVFSLDTCSLFSLNVLSDESGNIIFHGVLKDPGQMPYAFIYQVSPTLDSLQFKMFTDHPVMFQPSLLRKVDNSGYYFFLTGYRSISSDYNEAILDLDNSFSINHISGVPQQLTEYPNSKWINKKNFILTGRKDFDSNENDRGIGVLVIDTNYSLNHELYIGDHDTVEWPGMRKNLDYYDTNSIFVGGTHNFCQWEYCEINCWFSLSNMDSLLHLRWQKFYGGNANYTLWGLRATKDDGCLLYGTLYDSATQVNERDIYVIKVDQNGLVGGIDNKTNPTVHDAIVFPNPGSGYLIIESGPQISGAEFRMISIDGKQIIVKTLNERKTTLETQFLPSGTYVWQILFNNKVIETGKWIKK